MLVKNNLLDTRERTDLLKLFFFASCYNRNIQLADNFINPPICVPLMQQQQQQ